LQNYREKDRLNLAEQAYALMESGDLKGARVACNRALNKDPDDWSAVMVLAALDARDECWGASFNLLKRLYNDAPQKQEVLNNLGMACASLASSSGKDKYLDEAERYLRKACKKSKRVEILANLALTMIHQGDYVQAESIAREAIDLDSGNVQAREALGYACLHQKKWKEGFGNYEFNLGNKYRKIKATPGKYWEPGDRGLNLYVCEEQGIGDAISYASVIPDAAKHHKITYECDKRLEGLMRRSLPGVEVRGTRFDTDKSWMDGRGFDGHTLVASLCREYRQNDEDFPRTPYLVADPERRLQWRALFDTLPGKKIGIAWTGGLDNTFKSRRSFNLEGLLPILKTPGVTWVSLQYKDPTSEIELLSERHGIEVRHFARAVEKGCDYDETAALVSELDAVVSVTTATIHLCGALGKACYVLVPKRCRWFYQARADGSHSWYSSLRLYRQQDKWPVERVAADLKADLCG
jgi:tetratricopeptide (TPR) repeat protein